MGAQGSAVYIRSSLGIIAAVAMLMAKWLGMVELFVVGHLLAGAISALKTVMFIYMAECAPDRARGWSSTAIGSGASLMLLLASPLCLPGLFGNSWSWWLLPAGCLVLAMLHLFGATHFPESPKHLYIGNGAKEEAKQSALFYHGSRANLGGGGFIVSSTALLGYTLGQASVSLGIFNMTPILVGELFPHPARARATQALAKQKLND